MRQTIGILIIAVISLSKANAQTNIPDTLAYMKTIVANKAQFIGKPFSVLYDSLKIQIKFFSPFAHITYNIYKETATRFGFYFPLSVDDMYLTYPLLRISWQPYLDIQQARTMYNTNNGGGWSSDVLSHYATGIIADIKVIE